MAKNSTHPDIQLFDFLNGRLDEKDAVIVEAHLSVCDACASIAGLVRTLKQTSQSQLPGGHPGIGELASFFYTELESADSRRVATHLAFCGSCAQDIAQHSSAELASTGYQPAKAGRAEVSVKSWELIDDWEESNFGKPRPANEVLGQEMLDRLADHLNVRGVRVIEDGAAPAENPERIPVLIVSSSGEVRSVEFFDKAVDQTGASILRHSKGSERFDNLPIHALFDIGAQDTLVVSTLMHRDTARLEKARPDEESRRADYIIVED